MCDEQGRFLSFELQVDGWLLEIAAAVAMWEDGPWTAVGDSDMEDTELEESGWLATVDARLWPQVRLPAAEERARSSTTSHSRKAWTSGEHLTNHTPPAGETHVAGFAL